MRRGRARYSSELKQKNQCVYLKDGIVELTISKMRTLSLCVKAFEGF